MHLRTLGRLEVPEASVTQRKPLLLLAYLALEGPQRRAYLAPLFFPRGRARANLSVLLSRLRKGAPGSVRADATTVATDVAADAAELLARLERGRWADAVELYRGRFLGDAEFRWAGPELEEWIEGTRELLAARVQLARVALAEAAAAAGRFEKAAAAAEVAFGMAHAVPGADALHRLHTLLLAGGSPRAAAARREAAFAAGDLAGSRREARERLRSAGAGAVPPVGSGLPQRSTSFVGRDPELVEIARRLEEHRLLTLLGPGGVGKSRLALAAAHDQLQRELVPDGVAFVPLEAVTAPAEVPAALAGALGFDLAGAPDPLAAIADRLAAARALIVLDNFEHLLPDTSVVARLLRRCPHLRLLVTSRERLHLQGEWIYEVPGMAYPRDPGIAVPDARRFDAVQLFLARARQADPALDPTPAEIAAIVELCAAVDGLPLALELAASWARALPLAELTGEVVRNLDLLASPQRDVEARHRSVRASFEHSWSLLPARQRAVFARLSVFRGGFRREAAAAVADATLPGLAALLDRSLVHMAPGGRYELHPLLGQFAREKLAARPAEREAALERHAEHTLRAVAALRQPFATDDAVVAIATMTEELENATAAWRWAVARPRVDLLQAGAWMLAGFLLHTSRFGLGLELVGTALERAQALPDAPPAALGTLECAWAWLAAWGGAEDDRLGEVIAVAERGVAQHLRPSAATMDAIGFGYEALVRAAARQERFGAATRWAERLLATAVEVGDPMWTALGHKNRGAVEWWRGDHAAAAPLLELGLAIERREGLHFNQLAGMDVLGQIYLAQGALDEAEAIFREGLPLAQERGHQRMVVLFALGLGNVALRRGRAAEARDWFVAAREAARRYDAHPFDADIDRGLAAARDAAGTEAREPHDPAPDA